MLVKKDADYERYLRLRAVGKKLNSELIRRVQKKDIHRCGKDLGLLKKNTLIFQKIDAREKIPRKFVPKKILRKN